MMESKVLIAVSFHDESSWKVSKQNRSRVLSWFCHVFIDWKRSSNFSDSDFPGRHDHGSSSFCVEESNARKNTFNKRWRRQETTKEEKIIPSSPHHFILLFLVWKKICYWVLRYLSLVSCDDRSNSEKKSKDKREIGILFLVRLCRGQSMMTSAYFLSAREGMF